MRSIKKKIFCLLVNKKGFTLLELTITATLFIVILLQVGGMWASLNGWVMDLIGRANVDREARIAREFLVSDLVVTKKVTSGPFSGWTLHLNGDGSPLAKYWEDQGMLIRGGKFAVQTFPAAKYLYDSDFKIRADESATAYLDFKEDAAQVVLDIYMNKIEQEKEKEKEKKKEKKKWKKKEKKKSKKAKKKDKKKGKKKGK